MQTLEMYKLDLRLKLISGSRSKSEMSKENKVKNQGEGKSEISRNLQCKSQVEAVRVEH